MYFGFKMELLCPQCGSSVPPGTTVCGNCGAPAKLAVQTNLQEIKNRERINQANNATEGVVGE
jgi:predicted amidophosphoribosyltransferase